MDFTTAIGVIRVVVNIVWVVSIILIVMGGTIAPTKVGKFGLGTFVISSIAFIFLVPTLVAVFNKDVVGVSEAIESNGVEYYEVTVPKEDESIVLGMDYSINELKEMYNDDYEGEKFMDEEDVVVIELDTTDSYKVR